MAVGSRILRYIASDNGANDPAESKTSEVLVWDLPTRCFHWAIVLLVILSWVTADRGLIDLHFWSGSLLLSLVMFRLIWGIVGSTTSRFAHFLVGPATMVSYLKSFRRTDELSHIGHNPAGGWMIAVMLTVLIAQVVTGLFSNNDASFVAPLAHWVSKETSDELTSLHALNYKFILSLVWMHVVAIGFYQFVKGQNLTLPMITGKKYVSSCHPLNVTKYRVAVLLWLLCVGLTFWIVA